MRHIRKKLLFTICLIGTLTLTFDKARAEELQSVDDVSSNVSSLKEVDDLPTPISESVYFNREDILNNVSENSTNMGAEETNQSDLEQDVIVDDFDANMLLAESKVQTASSTKINVKEYGAVGNGTTDDSAAILKALNAALSSGKTLYFPSGTYYSSKNILINSNCTIQGESKENTKILFKDIVSKADYDEWSQRGLVTFNGDKLNLKNMSFKYIADNDTKYTRKKNQSGTEGVLFSIIRGNDILIDNCEFYVGGQKHPSMTCMWIKSELTNISNVNITNSSLTNNSESTVGGCLWISGHDDSELKVSDITVSNSSFSKNGNDEALSVWGYNISNINVKSNTFAYTGLNVQNDVFITFGMPNYSRTENLKGIYFTDNTINISGYVTNLINAQKLSASSDVHISNNVITGMVKKTAWFSCFAFNTASNVYLDSNDINISGDNVLAYMTYVGGKIESTNNSFTTKVCKRSMIIKSKDSKFFVGPNVTLVGDKFSFGDTNTVSEQSTIQYPASGQITFDKCSVDTSRSALHELKYQILTKNDNSYPKNKVIFKDCTMDCTIIIKFLKYTNTDISFAGTKCKDFSFIAPNNNLCIYLLDLTGVTCNRVRLNYVEVPKTKTNVFSIRQSI